MFDAKLGPKKVQISDSTLSNFNVSSLFQFDNYVEPIELKNLNISNIIGSFVQANNSNLVLD